MSCHNKKIYKRLPFSVYFWSVAVIAFSGLIVSIYLSISHYRVYTDIGYSSFCAISRAINCDTISQSPYSILWGVPVPVWGIIGYTFFLLFLPLAKMKETANARIWSLLFLVALGFSLYSIVLALISNFYIHSYCIMCVLTYGINLLLLYMSWIIIRRFGTTGIIKGIITDFVFLITHRKKCLSLFMPFFIIALIVILFIPEYWVYAAPTLPAKIQTGITNEGHPWIGAEVPELVIEEFSDYQCFQCKKMHFYLRRLVTEYPEKIRLVHRNYPLDHEFNPVVVPEPYHVGSGKLALISIAAMTDNKFWEINDLLFAESRKKNALNVKELAESVNMDYRILLRGISDQEVRQKLSFDVWEGMKLRLTGTPGYLINGKLYTGLIPSEILNAVME